ncbi:MAG: DUF1330 domain-containing protein [Gammaproteobacteria bacterium]|nr:DUF1330 domain-containing protein [Gammaproteobacteria bacterium]
MAGYWIIKGTIKDQAAFDEYSKLWAPIAKKYQAEFIIPGTQHQTREGRDYSRVAVVKFPSYDQALACYDDADYQASLEWAFKAYDRELVIVDDGQ